MYLDLSSNQGKIDWTKVHDVPDINGIILRSTTKNGQLDTRLIEYYNGILQHKSDIDEISVYKFSYERTYVAARMEALKTLEALKAKGIHYDFFYLDLEGFGGRDHTRQEANEVILAYMDTFDNFGQVNKLRLYFNYNYLKNIIDPFWYTVPIWLARYNKEMGDTFGANIVLWQYTSKGTVPGIPTYVDISKEVENV